MNTNKERVPRPKGLTELGQAYNNNGITLEELQNHTVNHYIATGFKYCGKAYNIEDFSKLTGIDQHIITNATIAYGQTTINLVDPNQSGDILRAVIGTLLNETLADRSRALTQLDILSRAQGQTYKPFVSGEVNKALKLTQESTAALLSLYKTMAPSTGPSVLVQNTINAQTQNNYITPTEALELIATRDQRPPLLEDPDSKELLFKKHNLQDTPEVQANKQQGVDLTKEGATFHKLAKVSDGLLEDPKDRHTNRRARELGIDLDHDEI